MSGVNKRTRLSRMSYNGVSFVDAGDNRGARIALLKQKPGGAVKTREVVEKKMGDRTCADCGAKVDRQDSHCAKCGSENIKKSLIIVRKEALPDDATDADLDAAVEGTPEDGADSEGDDPDDVDFSDEEDEEDDGSEDEDDDEGEDDEDESDEDSDIPVVKKNYTPTETGSIAVEVASHAVEFAKSITEIFSGDVSKSSATDYEATMVNFNTLMDTEVTKWFAGKTPVAKDAGNKASAVRSELSELFKSATEGGVMSAPTRPTALDGLDIPTDVAKYIGELESAAGVSSQEDIFKGLDPKVAEIVKNAAKVVEDNEVAKYQSIAESFTHVPGDKEALAKSLRTLSSDETAYNAMIDTLTAANENAKASGVMKSFGKPGEGEVLTVVEKRAKAAAELVEKGQFKTIEQAEVHLMKSDPTLRDSQTA